MVTNYTNVNKPSQNSYIPYNTVGKEQYDQSTIEYDDASIFYDGMNESLYSNVAKPSGTNYTLIAKP